MGKINELVNSLEHERQMNEYGELKESRAIISLKSSKSILYRERKKKLAMIEKLDDGRARSESSKRMMIKIDTGLRKDTDHSLMSQGVVKVVNSVISEDYVDVEGSVDIDDTIGVDNRSEIEDSHYLVKVVGIPKSSEMASKVTDQKKVKQIYAMACNSNSYADTDDEAILYSSE